MTLRRGSRLLPLAVAIVSASLLTSACGDQNSAVTGTGDQQQAGNPLSLGPLPGTPGSGPVVPVFQRSVVTATNSTATSTEPTLDSGLTAQGQYTFALAPLTPDPNVKWQTWSTGQGKWRLSASAKLVDGSSYQWKVTGPDGRTLGPYSMTVDISATNAQDGDTSGPVGVSLASGFAHYTWQTHKMEAASGSFGLGFDYSPANTGGLGVPAGWRMVVPSATGWDQLRTGAGGVVDLHAKNNSWISYTPTGNGAYQPVYSAKGVAAPTGMFGTLSLNADGSYTLTDTTKTVTTFAKPDSSGRAWVTSVSLSGQKGIAQNYDPGTGRLTSLTDTVANRTVEIKYGGWGCPTFDGFAATPDDMICQVSFWDGSTAGFGYVNTKAGPQLARLADYAGSGSGAQVTDLAYDDAGRLTSLRSPIVAAAAVSPASSAMVGNNPNDPQLLASVAYDATGRVATVTNGAPSLGAPRVSATYSYGNNNRTSIAIGPGGSTSEVAYDPQTFRPLERNANGATTRIEYDARGNPVKAVDAAGGVTTSEYDADGVIVAKRGPGGAQSTYQYDRLYDSKDPNDPGKPLQGLDVEYWSNPTWTGAPATSELGPKPSASAGVPSALSLSWQSPPVPGADAWSARMAGRMMLPAAADPTKPDIYRFTVNGSNKPTLWIDNVKCQASTCSSGIPLTAGGHQVRIDMSATQGAPGSLQLQYSRNGAPLENVPMSMLSPAYHLGTYSGTLDSLSPGSQTVLANRTSYSQPQIGQVGSIWNNAGLTTTTTYETDRALLGEQPVQTASGAGNEARVTGTVMPSGSRTALTYWGDNESASAGCADQSGQLQAGMPKAFVATDAASGDGKGVATQQWFMPDGSVAASQQGSAPPVCMYYDDAMRLVRTKTAGAGGQVSSAEINYALGGNPLASSVKNIVREPGASADTVTTSTSMCDLLGRPVEAVDVWGTKTTTTYSPLGQVASTTTSTANGGYSMTEKYTYTAGLLTHIDVTDSLSGAAPIVAADAVYDQASRLVSVRYSNATTGSVQYGANEIPAVSTWTEAGGTPWTSSNDYSPAGRIMSSTVARAGAQSKFDYTYDTSARLASAALATDQASPAKAWQYTYDANSNRTRQVIDGAATIDYAYNKADQLTSLTGDPRLAGNVTYDSLGSITAIGPLQMTYDVNGNVAVIADSVAKSSVTYTRDANQSVIAKTTTTDGKASTIRYSASGLLLNADNQPIMQLVSLPGGVSVQRAIAPAPGTAASQTWLYPSINGNTMFTTDGTGVSANAAPTLYDPFGQQLTGASTSPAGLPGLDLGWQGASGRQTEALSVPVTLMGARLYLPGLGRFTQVDPKVGGSANNYDYASQDPINGVDADGSAAWWKWVSAVAACIVISVVSAGATLALNASILAAGFSTVAATTLSLTAGAVVGAAGSVAAYAAQTAIVGSQWSWNDFAMAAIIGGLAGAYSGLAGMNNVGKTVLSGSLSAAKADGQIGLWKFAKALPGQIWNTGFGGTLKSTVAKYIVDPVQGSASLISLSGSRAFSAAANSAAKTLTCSALLSAAFKGVASAPGAVGGPIEGYHLEFKAGGFVVGTGATTLLGRFVCGG